MNKPNPDATSASVKRNKPFISRFHRPPFPKFFRTNILTGINKQSYKTEMQKLSGDAKLISYVQKDELFWLVSEGPKPGGCGPSAVIEQNQGFLSALTVNFLTQR